MDKNSIIVITGAAGFIGSFMTGYLNDLGFKNLILIDDFSRHDKVKNLADKKFLFKVDRDLFFTWIQLQKPDIKFIFHFGARTDTAEFDYAVHQKLNVEYSQKIWNYCTQNNVGLIYASSAATYGGGEFGYKDDHDVVDKLQPLNPYGISKNEFDKWALGQSQKLKVKSEKLEPPFWAGMKFFNVYGPNEYHKGRMASVIFHSYNQIKEKGFVKLFRSHKTGFKDGEQLRDFVYVKDVVKVCYWMMRKFENGLPEIENGLYNLGTGKTRSFKDLAKATFAAVNIPAEIEYINMPEDIREKYQYFTEADMQKLHSAGYTADFYSLEEGVRDYVQEYLVKN